MVLSTFNRELYEKELKEDAREEGWMEGRIEGAREKLRSQIQKKLAKGKTIREIADDLEETVETIRELM